MRIFHIVYHLNLSHTLTHNKLSMIEKLEIGI